MKLLTVARDLKRRKAREQRGLFVCEGVRSVEELLRSSLTVTGVLLAAAPGAQGPVSPMGDAAAGELAPAPLASHQASSAGDTQARRVALLESVRSRSIPVQEVSVAEFASASETDSPQGILAIAEVPDRSLDDLVPLPEPRLVILDAVQDPGNVGTILRSAAALGGGAAATLAMPGTVDLWNAKVVRSAMGAHFHHSALGCTWEALDAFRNRAEVAVWGADPAGEPLETAASNLRERSRTGRSGGLALVFGNEGAGLSAAARRRVEHLVSIPLSHAVESLNVAVAAGIFLYELRPTPGAAAWSETFSTHPT